MQDQDKNLINHQASAENQPTVIEANWTSNLLIQAKINYRMSGKKTDKYWLAWLIEDYFQGKSFDHLLSIGCGEGHHEILIAKLGFAEHIDAFDPNPENINLANSEAKSVGLNINFYQENIEDFSIQDNQQYDIIFCAGVLHRINQLEKCLQTLKNHLKPNGYLIINEYIGDCYHIYQEKQVAIINQLYRCFHPSLTTGKIGQFINRKITDINPDNNHQAVRSKFLIPFLNNYFQAEILNYYGGSILNELYPLLNHQKFTHDQPAEETIIKLLLEFEDILMTTPDGLSSDHCLGIYRHQPIKKELIGPDFIIIGGQKCGTTSLYNYLIKHPNIIPAKEKEVHFFDVNFTAGLAWYQSHFSPDADGKNFLTGEASPYYLFHPLTPQRLYDIFPQVKLIVLLRNPVERAISHYYWSVKNGYESLSFPEAIAQESSRLLGETEKIISQGSYHSFHHQHSSYLARGIYIEQLKQWWDIFPKEQILVISSEEFFTQPEIILNQVLEFLGFSAYQLPDYSPYNAGKYEKIDQKIYEQLENYFRPYNQELFTALGKDFNW